MAYTPPAYNNVELVLDRLAVPIPSDSIALQLADFVVDVGATVGSTSVILGGTSSSLSTVVAAVSSTLYAHDYFLSETGVIGDTTSAILDALVEEFVACISSTAQSPTLYGSISESIIAGDLLRVHFDQLFSDTVGAADTLDYSTLVVLVEYLAASSSASSLSNVLGSLADTLAIADALERGQEWSVIETAAGTDALTAVSAIYLEALETAVAAGAAGDGGITVFAAASESIVGLDALSAQQTLYQLVSEGVAALVHLAMDDEWFTGWVLNTELLAPSEYQNVPFNSACKLGDKYLAASSSGIYEFGGSTDNDSQIAAVLQTGVMDLGTNQLKRIEAMYLGYSTTGTLKLRVDAVTRGGQQTYWYDVNSDYAAGGGAPTESRVVLGKGLRSLYYRFALTNSEGCDMMLNTISILPAVTSRRV